MHTKILIRALLSEKGQIDGGMLGVLKEERMAKNTTYRQSERAHNDSYMDAMRLRYGYALTCHKAQGGEWNHVLLHPWFQQNDYHYAYTHRRNTGAGVGCNLGAGWNEYSGPAIKAGQDFVYLAEKNTYDYVHC